ncbi:hypothetical protein M8C21_016934, partial [Ambrosia artemisiifolia]
DGYGSGKLVVKNVDGTIDFFVILFPVFFSLGSNQEAMEGVRSERESTDLDVATEFIDNLVMKKRIFFVAIDQTHLLSGQDPFGILLHNLLGKERGHILEREIKDLCEACIRAVMLVEEI